MKYIIKFVSADGLVRYEDRDGNIYPETYLERRAVITPVAATFDATVLDPTCRTIRRLYKLGYHGIHPETGQYIFHYEEQL